MPVVELSVVVPARDEEATIAGFVERTFSAIGVVGTEVIVVDDSENYRTVTALDVGRSRYADQLCVRHRPPGSVADRTLGTAVVEGIGLSHGTYVCVMDADGQHPPEIIPELLAVARRTDADYVGASRYLTGGSAEGLGGWGRKLISRGLGLLARIVFLSTPVRELTDPLSGFFLFRRRLTTGVVLRPIGWKISLEVLVRARARRVAEVPYVFATRADGSSKASIVQGLLVLQHIVTLLWSALGFRRPVLFAIVGLSGVLVNTGSLLGLAWLGAEPLGWPIWLTTEVSILWNYVLNRRFTWGDRIYAHWWIYNLAAVGSALVAIGITNVLVAGLVAPLWLGSLVGIACGAVSNFIMFDRLAFAALPHIFGRSVDVHPTP